MVELLEAECIGHLGFGQCKAAGDGRADWQVAVGADGTLASVSRPARSGSSPATIQMSPIAEGLTMRASVLVRAAKIASRGAPGSNTARIGPEALRGQPWASEIGPVNKPKLDRPPNFTMAIRSWQR